jgi:hypothetical protein
VQPLALPVAAMSFPVDRANRENDAQLSERPKADVGVTYMAGVVLAECQRHDGE